MVIVERYYGLAVYCARKIHRPFHVAFKTEIQIEDLIGEGLVGLCDAAQRYDEQRNVDFATYAFRRVNGAIWDYLRRMDPLTARERQWVKELERVRDDLTGSLGRPPSTAELAQALGITEDEVKRREALSIIILSLEDLSRPDPDTPAAMPWDIPGLDPGPGKKAERKSLVASMNDCIQEALTKIEREVVALKWSAEMTFESIADVLNTSLASAQRWEVKARRKLRRCLEGKGWEITDI